MLRSVLLLTLAPRFAAAARSRRRAPGGPDRHQRPHLHRRRLASLRRRRIAVRDGRVQFVGSAREAMAAQAARPRRVHRRSPDTPSSPAWPTPTRTSSGSAHSSADIDLTDTARTTKSSRASSRGAKTRRRASGSSAAAGIRTSGATRASPRTTRCRARCRTTPSCSSASTATRMLANAAAMNAAGVTAATQDPAGGTHRARRVRRADRRLRRQRDGARSIASIPAAVARRDDAAPRSRAIAESQQVRPRRAARCRRAARRASTSSRSSRRPARSPSALYVMIGDDSAAIAHYFQRGPQSALVRQPPLDPLHQALRRRRARLARRGAARPVHRRPEEHRSAQVRRRRISQDVSTRALQHGFQVATHAIGDRGNRVALDAYEAALKAVPTVDHRFRIEHVQILDHADVPRFAQLGVIPSMQAVHQTSDMYWAANRLGYARTLGAYAWRSLLNTGVIIPNGSDVPGGARQSALLVPRRRLAPGRQQLAAGRLVPGAEDDARGSAQVHDHLAGVRGVPGARSRAR